MLQPILSSAPRGFFARATFTVLSFGAVLAATQVRAATNVSGPLFADTTWTAAAGPYVVTADVQVASGVTLTIAPGTTVQFAGAFQIYVKGVLIANGTNTAPIVFGPSTPNVSSGATMLKFEGTNLSNSQLSNLRMSYAARAVLVGGGGGESNPGQACTGTLTISQSVFDHVEIRTGGYQTTAKLVLDTCTVTGASTIIGQYPRSEPIEVRNSVVNGSVIWSDSYNAGILLDNTTATSDQFALGCCGANLDIRNSTIVNSNMAEGSGTPVNGPVKFSSTKVVGTPINLPRVAFTVDKSVFRFAVAPGIRIGYGTISNSSFAGAGTGVVMEATGYNGYDLTGDIAISGSTFSDGATTIKLSGANTAAIQSGNNFFRATTYDVENRTSKAIAAASNYWGVTATTDIAAKIYDYFDDITLGQVTASTPLTAPATAAPTSVPAGLTLTRSGNDVVLNWSANAEADVAGYKVYYGTASGWPYANVANVGNVTTKTFAGLAPSLYYFVVTAYDSSATSSAADITNGNESWLSNEVTTGVAVAITTQPASQTAVAGQTATMSVVATGNPAPTFKWQKNGSDISGATTATLTLANVQPVDAGNYQVVVTNALGSVTGTIAALTVNVAPTITTSPVNNTITVGSTGSFSVTASGNPAPTLQWQRQAAGTSGFFDLSSSSSYSGVNSATLSIFGTTPAMSGDQFRCVATNSVGTASSASATLTVTQAPTIISSNAVTFLVGTAGTFTVTAAGAPTPTFSVVSGTFPSWASFNSATGVISGTPPNAIGAPFTFTVQATNSVGTATQTFTLSVTQAPVITSASSVTFTVGVAGSFTFIATGAPAPSFGITGTTPPWMSFNGTTGVISGTPTSGSSASYTFTVLASNSVGSAPTQSFTLNVNAAPAIVTQPTGQSVYAGQSASFNVFVTGTPAPSLQWRKNGVAISGATNATLPWAVVQLSDAGTYDVVATNAAGSVISNSASLTVTAPTAPVITSQPVGGTLSIGNVGSFSVSATGTPFPTFQWRKNGVAVSGATGSFFVLGGVTATSAGNYDVVVTNIAGSVTSNVAVLTILPPVVITTQPIGAVLYAGSSTTLFVAATGAPTAPTYQWRKNGTAITGATNQSLVFSAVQTSDAGNYDVVATNSAGSATSNTAILTVNDVAPSITSQPVGGTLAVGGNLTLSVSAVGSVPLTYQWRRDGVTITGATTSSLAVNNAQTYQSGDYTVVVTNTVGNVTSAVARVVVVPRVVSYSARLTVDGDGALGVFTIEGTLAKKVLLRAVGPGLAPFGITGMADPQLELFDSAGNLIAQNNDWASSADATAIANTAAAVGAFGLTVGSRDAAIVRTLPPGTYTARATPASGAGGMGYLELYDADLATGPMSTLPYVAVRGRMGAGGGVVIGGLGSNGRGQRSYLVRAAGPALGLAGALANPSMLVVRDGTLVGNNDDWDANATEAAATTTATTRVAAFALPAGGRDSALVLTGNLHAGACTVQVGSADAVGGTVLLELHDLDATRPTTFAPTIVSPPLNATVAIGETVTVRVVASGTDALSYQWRKEGVPISGATTATLAFPAVQAANGGNYTVMVSNAQGSATSLPATLTVQGTGTGANATHAQVGVGYTAGSTVTITNTLTYSVTPTSLGWSVTLPAGWSFVSDAGTTGDVKPTAGTTGTLEWAWSSPPASPVTFTYTVNVPAGTSGDQQITAFGIVRSGGSVSQPIATPNPLTIALVTTHSADTNADFRISLLELTRVIEIYNTRNGTTRTGCYSVATTVTEDGFVIDATRASTATVTLARYHSADSNRDGKISLLELTRVIELYNTRSGTTRTGQYHIQAGTEDGYAAGP